MSTSKIELSIDSGLLKLTQAHCSFAGIELDAYIAQLLTADLQRDRDLQVVAPPGQSEFIPTREPGESDAHHAARTALAQKLLKSR